MAKIFIKIVDVDVKHQTVLVKYASEKSKKPIDEYDAVVFRTTFDHKTPEEFINSIKSHILYNVVYRDAGESNAVDRDLNVWTGYQTDFDSNSIVAHLDQIIPTLNTLYSQPEVLL